MTEPPSDDASARTPAPPPPAPAAPAHSLEPVFFMIALGLSTALSNAVGSHLGARRVTEARRASAIGVGVGLCSVVGYVACAYAARDALCALFSRDEQVLEAAYDMWPAWCFFMLISGAFALLLGLVKGLGLQRQMAALVVGVQWPLGTPLVWAAQGPAAVWQMLAITYGVLTGAMALCAGCASWDALADKAVRHSHTDADARHEADGGTSTGGLAAADANAAEARDLEL